MIFLLLIVIFISFKDAKFVEGNRLEGNFYTDYMSIEQTSAINGIFALLIFLSHSTGYLELEGTGPINDLYFVVRYYLMQLVVVTFLFYSGYGIMLSIMKKGHEYVKHFPRDRFLKVLIMLDAAVILYFIMGMILDNHFAVSQVLLSLIGLQDLGNSNWYIFLILIMYVVTYIAFMICRKNNLIGILLVFILTAAYIYIGQVTELPSRFWNTAIMYPVGMLYAYFKEPIDKFVMKNNLVYSICFVLAFAIFQVGYFTRDTGIFCYSVFCFGFMMCVVLFTMKVKVYNSLIFYLGKNLFPFYMLQRLPMLAMAMAVPDFINAHPYLFMVISFVITMCIAIPFQKFIDWFPLTRKKVAGGK